MASRFLSHVVGLDKTDVGLGNVDNTSDVSKPISTATQTALDGKKDYVAPVVVSFIDTFDRANVVGLAAVNNGWVTPNAATADIVSNALVRTDGASYRTLTNPAAGVTLPADYTVTAVMATSGASTGRFFYGLVGRHNGTEGVRAMFTTDGANIEIGNSSGYGVSNVYSGAPTLPPTWTNAGDHTLAMRMTGTLIELICDGVVVVAVNCSTNATLVGSGFGICGEGNQKIWRSLGASGTIGGDEPLVDDSVTTAAILDGAVTGPKILDNAVTTAKILNGAVTAVKIPDGVITPAKLSFGPALDLSVVHNTGNETIAGIKSFSSPAIITNENWIAATLTNSWTNYGGSFETAGYRKMVDGTVYLRGLIKTGTVNLPAFTLPVGYRPAASSVWLQIANAGMCRIDILGTGAVTVTSYITPGTSAFVSLSGIRFSVNG